MKAACIMSKLRSDSTWNRLTAEQRATLETWLFEQNTGSHAHNCAKID